jgi:Bacterial lipocalin
MSHRLTVRGVIAAALAFCSAAASAAQPVASVPELDLLRYAGQWHEIAHLPMFFQRQCVGDITARYSLDGTGSIGVLNACRTKDGSMDQSQGVARPWKAILADWRCVLRPTGCRGCPRYGPITG